MSKRRHRAESSTARNEPETITNPHGIIFRDPEQEHRYNHLSKLNIAPTRQIDWDVLGHFGFDDILRDKLRELGWWYFANLNKHEYCNLIYEFYSCLRGRDEMLEFRLGNVDRRMTYNQIGNILYLSRGGPLDEIDESGLRDYWRLITHQPNAEFLSRSAKSSSIVDSDIKLLHRFIVSSINFRKESPDRVLKDDLLFLWSIKNNMKLDVPAYIIDRLLKNARRTAGDLVGGVYITVIAETLGVQCSPGYRIHFSDVQKKWGLQALAGMGLLVKGGTNPQTGRIRYLRFDDPDAPAPVADRPPSPPPSASYIPSSSSHPVEPESFMSSMNMEQLWARMGQLEMNQIVNNTRVERLQTTIDDKVDRLQTTIDDYHSQYLLNQQQYLINQQQYLVNQRRSIELEEALLAQLSRPPGATTCSTSDVQPPPEDPALP